MDPLGGSQSQRTTLPPIPPSSASAVSPVQPSASHPSSPDWPRSAPYAGPQQPHLHTRPPSKEPRSPLREDDRRAAPGSLDGNDAQGKRPEPHVTQLRAVAVDRTKRDLFVRFNAVALASPTRSGHLHNISRAYREFALLHEALSANNPHIVVPAVPFPNTSAPDPVDDDRLILSAFQQFFDRILLSHHLRHDDELRLFLESDFGYVPATRARRRLTSSSTFGFSLSRSSATKLELTEEDDELAHAKLQFRLLEEKLSEASRCVESVARARRILAGALVDVSDKLAAFSTTEHHPPLAAGLLRLARSERALADHVANASVGEAVTLADGLGWCAVECKAGKDALKNRVGVMEDHHAAVKRSIDKRRTVEKIRSAGSVSAERVDAAMDELEEAKKTEDLQAATVSAISHHLRPSLRLHSKHLHDDLLHALSENARTQGIYERQTLKELELLRQELESIPPRDAGLVYIVPQSAGPGTAWARPSQLHRPGPGAGQPTEKRLSMAYPSPPMSPEHSRYQSTATTSQMSPPGSSAGQDDVRGGSQSMINTATIGRAGRISDMARSVIVTGGRGGEVDKRQAVDAKAAAASLARLF